MKRTRCNALDVRLLAPGERPTHNGIELTCYSDEQLHAAFDLVKTRAHWKYPVEATVTFGPSVDIVGAVMLIEEAIVHFTGSVADYGYVGERGVAFDADGYYAVIGS